MHVVPRAKIEEPGEQLDQRRAAELAKIGRFLQRLQDASFFGRVTISFQNGKVTTVGTEQSLKLDEL